MPKRSNINKNSNQVRDSNDRFSDHAPQSKQSKKSLENLDEPSTFSNSRPQSALSLYQQELLRTVKPKLKPGPRARPRPGRPEYCRWQKPKDDEEEGNLQEISMNQNNMEESMENYNLCNMINMGVNNQYMENTNQDNIDVYQDEPAESEL